MDRTTWDFLDEYKYSDFNRRLHMFLQYPELRSDFTQIEREINGGSGQIRGQEVYQSFTLSYLRLLAGFVKRYCRQKPKIVTGTGYTKVG